MKKNNNNWLYILVSILSASTIVFLCLFLSFSVTSNKYRQTLENNYKKNFYEVASNINDMEIDISKIVATKDRGVVSTLLNSLHSNVNLTLANVNQLPITYDKLTNINMLLNKIGGFSQSLIEKVFDGDALSDEDYTQINNIHTSVLSLKYDINNYYVKVHSDFEILANADSKGASDFSSSLLNTESANSKVPSLIYDGPFSESVLNKEIVGLSGEDISQAQALDLAKKLFETEDVSYQGLVSGKFTTYNFYVNRGGLNVAITKKGGLLLSVTSYGSSGQNTIDANEGVKVAENFARTVGLDNMYSVWTQACGNILYVNLAPIVNSCIYYSDLVKVKVDLVSSRVVGWEATNYATNHKSRVFTSSITFREAEQNLSSILKVEERNYTIIPDKYVGEVSAYEFICSWKNYTYYIYINSNTGAEANILRVIDTDNGELLE
ncbi:MAG: germination protein YpeB [Firmicutes bacterium]|nr:germination protein YpeB [Bacillota bacterium]MDY5676458.1 germination protein YpeB [Eubacteriales bacterium]